MADNREEIKKQDSQDYEFVKERIIERPKKKTPFLVKLICMIILGLAFGCMGAVSFVLVLPYAQQVFEKQEEPSSGGEQIVIPKDDENETNSTTESTTLPTTPADEQSTTDKVEPATSTSEQSTEALSEDAVNELIQKALEEKKLELSDYERLFDSMYEVVTKANNSIVTIISVKNSTDIMNNPYEESETTSGVIYNVTENTVFILTDWDSVKSADFIRVSFPGGFSCDAAVRMYDISSNMAVVCVDTVLFDEHSLGKLQTMKLGNSYTVKQGNPVIAVGNPMGYMYTMSYGIITSIKNTLQSVDAVYRRLDSDIVKSNSGNGFLINLNGELIGLINNSADSDSTSDVSLLNALALSDLKGRLEVISNNREVAYMGIIGQDITSDIAASQNLPQGIYVSQTIIDSPVYTAGMQNGDIIVAMADMSNMSMKSMRNYLEEAAEVGDTVSVTVMRKGKNGYAEISLDITFGAYK